MSADSAANQVERASLEEEINDEEDDDDDEVTNQLSNGILDKIIDYALTGTKSIVTTTFRSLGQLDDHFKRLTSRYICRLPQNSLTESSPQGSNTHAGVTCLLQKAHSQASKQTDISQNVIVGHPRPIQDEDSQVYEDEAENTANIITDCWMCWANGQAALPSDVPPPTHTPIFLSQTYKISVQ
ncbi:hypothetical protein ACROYT_G013603 [Oculina patagonica]